MRLAPHLEGQRGVLVDDLVQGAGELHLVVPVFRRDGERKDRRFGGGKVGRGGDARGTERLPRRQRLDLGERHDLAGACFGGLVEPLSEGPQDRADPLAADRLALVQRARPDAAERKLAGVTLVQDLEALGRRGGAGGKGTPPDRLLDDGRVVAQRLQQAPHAVFAVAGAQQDRRDLVGTELVVQVAVDQRLLRRDVLDELLEQRVVELREGLQHVAPRLGFARQDLGRHLDQVGGAAAPVAIGALAHEVDITHRLLAAVGGGTADRHLAQHQLALRHGLQGRQHVAHADFGGIDLVDEDDVRDVPVLDEFQERRQRHHALGRGFADQDRGVADGQRREGIVLELDRARDVEEGPLVAEIVDGRDVDLGAHAALARFGGRVAYGGACAGRAAPADGSRGVENAFEQAGLARQIRPAQRHHAMRAAAWSAASDGLRLELGHDNVLLLRKSVEAPDGSLG